MNKVLGAATGLVLGAGSMLSTSAMAELSGNVSAVSDYMFRGLSQSGGAAVQGGLDYASDTGLYAGTWASNINFGGNTEQDLYVGFSTEAGPVSLDVSALYYWYLEDEDGGATNDCDTLELGLSVGFGPVTLGAAYGDETNFFACDGLGEAALYLSAAASFDVSEKLVLDVSIGQYSGDEIERNANALFAGEDTYLDYMIGLSSDLGDGLSASFQYIGTDIEDDDPKFVVGLAKSFDL